MINEEIIQIASNTKYVGLKNIYTHKSSAKNSICGDIVKIQLITNKSMIKSMRYETESCVLCEASASLLASLIRNFHFKDIKHFLTTFNNIKKSKKFIFPPKFKEFNKLLNTKTLNRVNCVILPIEALKKALKMKI